MEINDLFKENLVKYRGKMTQQKLADSAKIAVATLRDYESGRRTPSMEAINKIAKALDIKPFKLLEEPDPKIIEMPVSKVLKKMTSIPDEIYDMSEKLTADQWKSIASIMEGLIESTREKEDKKAKKG